MARKEKRQCLFTKYEFEIGICTLPAYLCLFFLGLSILGLREGIALAIIGIIGSGAALYSILNGYKDVKW